MQDMQSLNLVTFQDLKEPVSPAWSVTTIESDLPSQETSEPFAQFNKTSQPEGNQQTKYRQLRDKNNKACRESRKKKRERFQDMERRISQLEAENRMLRHKLKSVTFNSQYPRG